MSYYIEIIKPDGEIVAGEMQVEKEVPYLELVQSIMDFASDEGICPRWAVDHCKYKIKTP